MKVSKKRPVHLDSAEQIAILLEAAGDLDRGDNVVEVQGRRGKTWTQRPALQTTGRRAAFATLLLGGGRASATGAMLWRDIDLANARFEVGRDKTDAGMREVDMLPLLREILTEHKAGSEKTAPDDPVFVTSTGTARSRHNLRQNVVDPVVNRANRLIEERGLQPLPLGVSPHKLRQDFRRIEANTLARAQPVARLIFTTDRQFPRGDPATLGRLVSALDALLAANPDLATALFLKPAPPE